jgi:hypothetical protein
MLERETSAKIREKREVLISRKDNEKLANFLHFRRESRRSVGTKKVDYLPQKTGSLTLSGQ